MAELTAPFVFKNDEKRIVYGPVLVPNEPDSDNDVVTADQIETVAHKFVEDYGNIDLQHSLNNVGKMIESYVLPMDLETPNATVPKGSWMLGVRVTDNDAWNMVKSGKLGGFSIMGIAKQAMKSKEKEETTKGVAEKRTTLADLGDDFIVNAVSLVDEPAVPKAKWISIKSKNQTESVEAGNDDEQTDQYDQSNDSDDMDNDTSVKHDDRSVMDKLMGKLGYVASEKAGRTLSESNYRKLLRAKEVIDEVLEIGDSERDNDTDDSEQEDSNVILFNQNKSKEGETMKKEEIEGIIEKRMEPINNKIDDLIETMKSANDRYDSDNDKDYDKDDHNYNSDNDTNDQNDQNDQSTKSDDNNDKDFEQKYNDVLKELEKAKKHQPLSKRIAGQDNLAEKQKNQPDRNAFGFKNNQ